MDKEDRVIEVRRPELHSVAKVVAAATTIGATYALVFFQGRPRTVIATSELDADDDTAIAERVSEAPELEEHDVTIEVAEGESAEVHAYVQEGEFAVLDHGDARMVMPLEGVDLERALRTDMLAFAAHDIELPGEEDDEEDLRIPYTCVLGHTRSQSIDDPNRICPFPGCGRELRPIP